jgi:hypothetical protein
MARKPAGWNASMLAPNASTVSGGVAAENIVGSSVPTNSSGDRSASTRACRRRCSASSGGREPAHPAYADASVSVAGTAGCRR